MINGMEIIRIKLEDGNEDEEDEDEKNVLLVIRVNLSLYSFHFSDTYLRPSSTINGIQP